MWDCGACGSAYTPYIYGEYMYQFIYTLSLIIQCISKIIPTPPQTLETLINTGFFLWDITTALPHKSHIKIFSGNYTLTGIILFFLGAWVGKCFYPNAARRLRLL